MPIFMAAILQNLLLERRFLRQDIRDSSVQFISKCGIQLKTPNRSNELKHYDCSKAYIISSAEASLKHLQTDYLDVLLIHRPVR